MENQIKLRWTSHSGTVLSMLDTLLSTESMVDVTLACDGQYVRAHKVVLSACSPYFQDLFALEGNKNPILYLHGVKQAELNALMHYMYRGEVSVPQEQLSSILEIAKGLKIRGLADVCSNVAVPTFNSISSIPDAALPNKSSPNSNSTSTLTVMPVLIRVPSPTSGVTTSDSSSSNTRSISTDSGQPFINSEHLSLPRLQSRPNAPPSRKKLKADYTQKIKLNANPCVKVLGPVSTHQHATPSEPSTSKKSQVLSFEPLEPSHRTEAPLQPHDQRTEYNGEDEQLHSFLNRTDDEVKVEVLEGFEPEIEVIQLEDENSLEEPDIWDRSSRGGGLTRVIADSSMETGDGIPELEYGGGDMSRMCGSGAEIPNMANYSDDSFQTRNRRSGVWQHFTTVGSDDGDGEFYSQCNYCHKKYKRSTSTTNMKSHLNQSHQVFY